MHNSTVLIVDDEINIISSISRLFIDDNYRILGARSGEEGLVTLKKHDVDLVISDQRMPGMSGLKFIKKVSIGYPDILTIMLTAFADIDIAIKAINEAGVYKFILKPWNDYELRLTVNRALELRRLITERNSLLHKIKKQESILRALERSYPGITAVERDESGYVVVKL